MGRMLDLVRDCRVRPGYEPGIVILVEDGRRTGAYVCELVLEGPGDPLSPWRREYLRRASTDRRGSRLVGRYERVPEGLYECRSLRRHGEMRVIYVEVKGATITVLGHAGDEDLVRVRLAGVAPEDLAELRRGRVDARPPMRGTSRQVDYAESLRSGRLAEALEAGDPMLAIAPAEVADASWWIARRHDPLERLRDHLPASGRKPRPDGPDSPW